MTPTPGDLVAEMLRLSARLDQALAFFYDQSQEWAVAEDAYRSAKARAYLASDGTVPARNAQVDEACAVERQRAHLADAMRQAALEAVRSRRAQLSACQSVANAVRSEVEMARTGPAMVP